MQTAIGGVGTLFGPLVGAAVWLYLSDFFQNTLHLGSTWKLVLGVVFVLLVVFLRRGVIGGLNDLITLGSNASKREEALESDPEASGSTTEPMRVPAAPKPAAAPTQTGGVVLETRQLTRRYGGLLANRDIDFSLRQGELRGIIGPNGAGKSTFFKMLTCEVRPTSGKIVFGDHDITGWDATRVSQLGLTKSYQVNQLFNRLTVRENIAIAALAQTRGPFRIDLLRGTRSVPGLEKRVEEALALVKLSGRADVRVSELAYGEKRRLEIGLALATRPSLLLLDEPLAGMSPHERVETVMLLKSIRAGPHAGRHRSRHGRDLRVGRAHHCAAARGRSSPKGRPRRSGPTRPSRKPTLAGCTRHEPARSLWPQQLLRRLAHPVRRRPACRKERGCRAARPQRRRQDDDAQEPDGHGASARRLDPARRRANSPAEAPHVIARAGMQLVPEERRDLRQPQCRGEHRAREP